MSKIGNYRVGIQETDDYRFGWESAERGEPLPDWGALFGSADDVERLKAQRLGWSDYHDQELVA